jgi:uncharacterized Fe-S cluster-containing radical SAM superfamily enzyme
MYMESSHIDNLCDIGIVRVRVGVMALPKKIHYVTITAAYGIKSSTLTIDYILRLVTELVVISLLIPWLRFVI